MNQYKIFKHPSGIYEAVKQGWSWPAFFFGFIWVLVKKIWWLALGLIVVSIILQIILVMAGVDMDVSTGPSAFDIISSGFGFVISLILGANGNAFREKNLFSRGYEQVGIVSATTPDGAIAIYIEGGSTQIQQTM